MLGIYIKSARLTFKDHDRYPINHIRAEKFIQGAVYWLKGGDGKKIGSPIPRDIAKGMKLGRYLGNGDVDNACVEGDKKCAEE